MIVSTIPSVYVFVWRSSVLFEMQDRDQQQERRVDVQAAVFFSAYIISVPISCFV